MIKYAIILLLGSCTSLNCFGQFNQDNTVQLVNGERQLEPYQNKLKPDLRFDARRTLFQQNWVAIGGLRLGVQYRRIHRIGFGFYLLNNRIFEANDIYEQIPQGIPLEYDFSYNTLFYERALYFDKRWEVGANVHLGGGDVGVRYQPPGTTFFEQIDKVPFSLTEGSVYGNFNILYWLGIGAGLGYRRVWARIPRTDNSFSSPIFAATVQIRFVKLARSFFDESVKDEF